MNLFYDPSITALNSLIEQNSTYRNAYALIVDHDGEVLVEPFTAASRLHLNKYRFYFKGFLWSRSCRGDSTVEKLQYLNQLYKNLMYCWENDYRGSVVFDEITRLQQQHFWTESGIMPEIKADPGLFQPVYHTRLFAARH